MHSIQMILNRLKMAVSVIRVAIFSRAYLRHLIMAKELLAVELASIHNLYFLESLMRQIRYAIKEKRLAEMKKEWFPKT